MTNTISARRNRPIVVLVLLSVLKIFSSDAKVVINEIAYKGSGQNTCDTDDWIELLNTDINAVDLTGYVLREGDPRDDRLPPVMDEDGMSFSTFAVDEDDDAMIFPSVTMAPGEFLVLCKESFGFGVGTDDTINLLDATGTLVDSVTIPEDGTDDETYALLDGDYTFTTTPTPGGANVYTERIPMEAKLKAQNDAANDFFLVDDAETFGQVVDIHIVMREESLATIQDHPAWEKYVPFDEFSVSRTPDANEPIVSSSGGRIRTKGRWSKTITACFGQSNVPLQIKFDTPFLGMEKVYLRNHQDDPSFMRDHASHTMLKAFGLPYLRTRPVRVFLNGAYTGFYTLMEAPTQAYVMQRSFGAFNPETTALFKGKNGMDDCPFSVASDDVATRNLTNPYYFERGEHREDIPVLGSEGYYQCIDFFYQVNDREYADAALGFQEYDNNCGLALVKMGLVDRDFGPKAMEDPMIVFLETKFYNESNHDLTDSVDADQWLKNMASYAIMLNFDSPMSNLNNWYLATTNGGANDWKIVQYDHHGVMYRNMAHYSCDESCSPRMVYWPILRPTCNSNEDNMILGRLLHSEENVQKYLSYVQEYVDALTSGGVLEKLYDYGNGIKEYVMEDPWSYYPTIEAYADSELGADMEHYNTDDSPFLKTIQVRLQEVQKQLNAIRDGTLPRDGVYDEESVCPDWRDNSSEDYISLSNVEGDSSVPDSGTFVESEICGSELSECAAATECFDHKSGICAFDGEILTVECQEILPKCKPCFPHSRCSSDNASYTQQGLRGESSGVLTTMAPGIAVVVSGLCWLCFWIAL